MFENADEAENAENASDADYSKIAFQILSSCKLHVDFIAFYMRYSYIFKKELDISQVER